FDQEDLGGESPARLVRLVALVAEDAALEVEVDGSRRLVVRQGVEALDLVAGELPVEDQGAGEAARAEPRDPLAHDLWWMRFHGHSFSRRGAVASGESSAHETLS